MKTIDSFIFFNEFDMLKLRLQYLNDVVDYFIISESNYTHSGKIKPYYLDQIWSEIPTDVRNKIVRLKYEPDISKFNLSENVNEFDYQNANWKLEREQRDIISNNLFDYSSNDLFMLSDVDEIPNKELIKKFMEGELNDDFCCSARCEMFYYNFVTLVNNHWCGTVFTSIKNVIQKGCDYLRSQRFALLSIDNGGWHFSYFGDLEYIKTKLDSFAHQEYNKEKYKSDQNIIDAIKNKKDVLQRTNKFSEYNFYNFPEELRNLITKRYPQEYYITVITTSPLKLIDILEKYSLNGDVCIGERGFNNGGTDKNTSHSYISFFYEEVFNEYKNQNISLLEIGIQGGASLKLWKEYFVNSKNIVGIDISENNVHQNYKNINGVEYFYGNAYSDQISEKFSNFDIIIDDGPHTLDSQLDCILKYLPKLNTNGILVIEDVQDIEFISKFIEYVKIYENDNSNSFYKLETIDLRKIKNRYDDILFTIRKQ
jgi:beta-1,4-mannosyl-glycoprotein beta-1,4-N-acetylglucosaminyltransferase